MNATLLELPGEMSGTLVPCADCPALRRLERELGELRREVRELRCEVGYWRSRHADAVKRNERLSEELAQAKGQVRALEDKLFGRKSEKSARGDRSNDWRSTCGRIVGGFDGDGIGHLAIAIPRDERSWPRPRRS